MKPASSALPLLFVALCAVGIANETKPAEPSAPPAPAKSSPSQPAPAQKPRTGMAALNPEEQAQLRTAREQVVAKDAALAAARKSAADAYKAAKEAKDAGKPKAEVDALYAKARELRAAAYKATDDAVIAANPALKPLIERSARPTRAAKDGAKGKDASGGRDGE